jgi:phosphatidylserine synthase 2
MTSVNEDNPDLSATSPADDSDAILSPVADPEPNPGLDGMPVRCE